MIDTPRDHEGQRPELLPPIAGGSDGANDAIVITRTLEAPRERVFAAFTDPELLKRWWGPNGFTTPVARIDPRPGGIFHACMRSPDGQDFWSRGVYREIVAPARIVSTDTFADADGNVVEPSRYGMGPTWPREAVITLTFADRGGRTDLHLHHHVPGAAANEQDMCRQGWNESLDRLAASLATA